MLQLLKEDSILSNGLSCPLESAELHAVYRAMVRVRLLDEKMLALQR